MVSVIFQKTFADGGKGSLAALLQSLVFRRGRRNVLQGESVDHRGLDDLSVRTADDLAPFQVIEKCGNVRNGRKLLTIIVSKLICGHFHAHPLPQGHNGIAELFILKAFICAGRETISCYRRLHRTLPAAGPRLPYFLDPLSQYPSDAILHPAGDLRRHLVRGDLRCSERLQEGQTDLLNQVLIADLGVEPPSPGIDLCNRRREQDKEERGQRLETSAFPVAADEFMEDRVLSSVVRFPIVKEGDEGTVIGKGN